MYKRSFALEPLNLPWEIADERESFMTRNGRVRRRLDRLAHGQLSGRRVHFIEESSSAFDGRWHSIEAAKSVYLEGLFQSPAYFCQDAPLIRSDLKSTAASSPTHRLITDSQNSGVAVIAVGVRHYEEAESGSHDVDPPAFYETAILRARRSAGRECRVIVFSSDVERARLVLAHVGCDLTFIEPDKSAAGALNDMSLMARSDHFVVSNSSFYWWSAWLSEAESKQVFASPRFRNSDVYPSGWELVPA